MWLFKRNTRFDNVYKCLIQILWIHNTNINSVLVASPACYFAYIILACYPIYKFIICHRLNDWSYKVTEHTTNQKTYEDWKDWPLRMLVAYSEVGLERVVHNYLHIDLISRYIWLLISSIDIICLWLKVHSIAILINNKLAVYSVQPSKPAYNIKSSIYFDNRWIE